MEDTEYVARLGRLYEHLLSLRTNSNYVVNQPQMNKLIKCIDFFVDLAQEVDGKVLKSHLDPREESGDVIARFPIIDIYGDKVQKFAEIVSFCSVIGIDPTSDNRVEISCTIPNVFVPLAN